jgi:hypothetical protein
MGAVSRERAGELVVFAMLQVIALLVLGALWLAVLQRVDEMAAHQEMMRRQVTALVQIIDDAPRCRP